jgi:hypothetical protein
VFFDRFIGDFFFRFKLGTFKIFLIVFIGRIDKISLEELG